MRGHAHITTVGVAPFAKGCVLLWIFPLWVLPSASFSSSPFLFLLSRSRFYSYFFFNGINKQQFSSVLTLKWKIYSAFIRFILLFSPLHSHKFHTTCFTLRFLCEFPLISRPRIRRLAPSSFCFSSTSCSLFCCDELGCSAHFFLLTFSTMFNSRHFRVTTFGIVMLWMQECKQK